MKQVPIHQFSGQNCELIIIRAKLRKATGQDDIPAEVLKNDVCIELIHTICVQCFNLCKIHTAWRKVIVSPIFKGNDKDPLVPENYRGITLINPLNASCFCNARMGGCWTYGNPTEPICLTPTHQQIPFTPNKPSLLYFSLDIKVERNPFHPKFKNRSNLVPYDNHDTQRVNRLHLLILNQNHLHPSVLISYFLQNTRIFNLIPGVWM